MLNEPIILPKPCPVCGGMNLKGDIKKIDVFNALFFIVCKDCGTRGQAGPGINDAISLWNNLEEKAS